MKPTSFTLQKYSIKEKEIASNVQSDRPSVRDVESLDRNISSDRNDVKFSITDTVLLPSISALSLSTLSCMLAFQRLHMAFYQYNLLRG